MGKYFLTNEQTISIVNHYGGLKKYKINSHIKEKEHDKIYYCEKDNRYRWLTIENTNNRIMITLTNDVGLIIQRDFWYLSGEECVLHSEESIKLN